MQDKVQILYDMLTYKRPLGGATEGEYIDRFLRPLGVKTDRFGNLHLTIGEAPSVLWSSHTDTVHGGEGRQKIELDGTHIRLSGKSKSSCLGADCAAGNWIMMEMIAAGVPGLYIFHYGEERGQIGANKIRTETPEVLAGIQSAVAFDRRGTDSVITHQVMRTCSDAFGLSLVEQMPGFRLDDTGTVTDTKVYRGLVPECTNISVGYSREHSPQERLDVEHLLKLRDLMVDIDAGRFVIERKPEFDEGVGRRLGSSFGGSFDFSDPPRRSGRRASLFEPITITELVREYPRATAAVLEGLGVTFEAFEPLVIAKLHEMRTAQARRSLQDDLADAMNPPATLKIA